MQKYLLQCTDKAIEAVQIGIQEMIGLRRRVFTPVFILLGLIDQPDSVVETIIGRLQKHPERVLKKLREACLDSQDGEGKLPSGAKPNTLMLTPEIEAVFQAAQRQAENLKDSYIGCGTLFLALFEPGAGVVSTLLREAGVDPAEADKAYGEIRGQRKLSEKDAEQQTDILSHYTTDLTELARQGKLDPVIGREREINRIIQVLSRRKKNNPVLIGESGVGKTVIVEGLASLIASAQVPETLLGKRVLLLDMGDVIAGAKMRGEFEGRIKAIRDEVIAAAGQFILFIDELHLLVGAGNDSMGASAGNLFKPALARGQLQCIGATTTDEYKGSIEKDKALERRFQPVLVDEPSVEMTVEILKGLAQRYEEHHQVSYLPDALKQAAVLSERYIADRNLPDKAIDLIDEAGSRKHLEMISVPPEVSELERKRRDLVASKLEAFKEQEFESAARFQMEEQKLKESSEALLKETLAKRGDGQVGGDDIAAVVAEWTGIPVVRLAEGESQKLASMEENLHQRIIGQENAVQAICEAIRRNRAGLRKKTRPIGSFLFLGPTGVGKTELAKALAEFLLDDETRIIRLDMSEYQERHQVARLIGAPPGYIGYGEGGQLTERVRRRPYSVVLLDEFEKAHHDVFNVLLQILDEGTLTDSEGRSVSFRNTIVIGTSNIGSHLIAEEKRSIGFGAADGQIPYEEAREIVLAEVKKTLKPELLNRLDDVIVFHQLSRDDIRAIVDLELSRLSRYLEERRICLQVTPEVRDFLAEAGYNPVYGARPLRREIEKLIENPLSLGIIDGKFADGDQLRAVMDGDRKILIEKDEELDSGRREQRRPELDTGRPGDLS